MCVLWYIITAHSHIRGATTAHIVYMVIVDVFTKGGGLIITFDDMMDVIL